MDMYTYTCLKCICMHIFVQNMHTFNIYTSKSLKARGRKPIKNFYKRYQSYV